METKRADLKNNSFSTQTLHAFRNVHNDKYFTDVTLVSGDDKQSSAHKVLLSSSSDVLRNMFIKNQVANLVILLSDISFTSLQQIINFIYTGECQVPVDILEDFLAAGKKLQIKERCSHQFQ